MRRPAHPTNNSKHGRFMRIPLFLLHFVLLAAAGCGDGRKPAVTNPPSPSERPEGSSGKSATYGDSTSNASAKKQSVDPGISRIEPSPPEPPPPGSQLSEWVTQLSSSSD